MGTGKNLWRQFETLFNVGDFEGVGSLFTSDAVYTSPLGRNDGPEAIRANLETVDRPFTDGRMEITRLIEEGDIAVAEWHWSGIHTSPIHLPFGSEIPATGRTIELEAASVASVKDRNLARVTEYFDRANLIAQLGLMPGARTISTRWLDAMA
jgi:steroid delta-isomerase-like uncharacterized protein